MQAFRISGSFLMGRNWTPFSLEVAAPDEAGAREKTFSTIGSRHRASRREIKIENAVALSNEEITDDVVKRLVSGASQ